MKVNKNKALWGALVFISMREASQPCFYYAQHGGTHLKKSRYEVKQKQV